MKFDETKGKYISVFIVCLILYTFIFVSNLNANPVFKINRAANFTKLQLVNSEDPLDEDAATELIDELTEKLNEILKNDERKVDSITEKWEATELVGKTRSQALNILFADVKRILPDAQTRNAIWNSWNLPNPDGDEEPGAVGENNAAIIPLTTEKKKSLAYQEMVSFRQWVGQYKALGKETGNYKEQTYTIFKDTNDPELNVKVAAVHKAVKTIVDKGIQLPANLQVYCLAFTEVQTRGFKRDEMWNPVSIITLGYKAQENNTGKTTISTSGQAGFDKVTITMIHEVGHLLHEKQSGEAFWVEPIRGIPVGERRAMFGKVSGYAQNHNYEFVAEVFAGSVIGMKFPADVLAVYNQLGGPKVN